jgi:hypothetical protein
MKNPAISGCNNPCFKTVDSHFGSSSNEILTATEHLKVKKAKKIMKYYKGGE